MFDRIRYLAVASFLLSIPALSLPALLLPGIATAAEMRLESPPVRAVMEGDIILPGGFPNARVSSTGALQIGQTYAEVRALLLASNPATRISVQNRRFQLREVRSEPNIVTVQAEIYALDRSYVERLRLRFTSKMTGQRLYFIHRNVEFRKVSSGSQREFVEQMAARFSDSTWSMATPGFFSFRQIFSDGRMLSWGESLRRPELGGCFLLSGGALFETVLDESGLNGDQMADIARCGGGVDADWRGDVGRFTVTLIDFPLFREDREILRRTLEAAARETSPTPLRAQP